MSTSEGNNTSRVAHIPANQESWPGRKRDKLFRAPYVAGQRPSRLPSPGHRRHRPGCLSVEEATMPPWHVACRSTGPRIQSDDKSSHPIVAGQRPGHLRPRVEESHDATIARASLTARLLDQNATCSFQNECRQRGTKIELPAQTTGPLALLCDWGPRTQADGLG